MKFNGIFIVRQIGDSYYAVPTGATATEMKCMLKLNDTAAFLFEKASEGSDEETLTKLLSEKFSRDEESAKSDVSDFVATLKGAKIIE